MHFFIQNLGPSPHPLAHTGTAGRHGHIAISPAQRARSGTRIGLLDGVPLSWKDNFDAAGAVCEAGSALLKGRVPAVDAEVLGEKRSLAAWLLAPLRALHARTRREDG